jgi:hypothetical protein
MAEKFANPIPHFSSNNWSNSYQDWFFKFEIQECDDHPAKWEKKACWSGREDF